MINIFLTEKGYVAPTDHNRLNQPQNHTTLPNLSSTFSSTTKPHLTILPPSAKLSNLSHSNPSNYKQFINLYLYILTIALRCVNIVEVRKMVKNFLLHIIIVLEKVLPSLRICEAKRRALLLRHEDFIPYTIFKGEYYG